MIETSEDVFDGGDLTVGKNQGYFYERRWFLDQESLKFSKEETSPSMTLMQANLSRYAPSTPTTPSTRVTFDRQESQSK